MRILQVTSAYYPELQFGGPPQKIHSLSRELVRRGHEVTVLTLNSADRYARHHVEMDGVQVYYIPWLGTGSWQMPLGWRRVQSAVHWADVVHCYGLYNLLCPLAAAAAGQAGRRFVLEPLGMFVPIVRSITKKKIYHAMIGKWMVARATRVVATSAQERDELAAATVDPGKIVVRRNGIDLASFQRLPPRGTLRKFYDIAAEEQVILFLSRLSSKKGLNLLLSAFAELSIPNTRLLIAGPESENGYQNALQQQAAELGVGDRVIFAGPLYGESKLQAFADADVFVLPSMSENFGNVIAESVAAKVPVIITDRCGISPFIKDRVGLVIGYDADQLRTALARLLTDEELLNDFKAHCPAVAQEFAWDAPVSVMEDIYLGAMTP
jgi:glycosyltransferase involved in cell wall biosynthesis